MKTSRCRWMFENRCVFSARLKALFDRSGDRSAGGRRFDEAGPLTAKLRCPAAVCVQLNAYATPQSGNRVSTSLSNSGLCWTVFARNRDTVVPAERNGDLQTLICVFVARPRQCPTLSNPVPWQNWMAAYLGYTLRMKTLFRGWPVMVHDTHTRRRRMLMLSLCCVWLYFCI